MSNHPNSKPPVPSDVHAAAHRAWRMQSAATAGPGLPGAPSPSLAWLRTLAELGLGVPRRTHSAFTRTNSFSLNGGTASLTGTVSTSTSVVMVPSVAPLSMVQFAKSVEVHTE